jgi:hypothetical protein
MLDGDLATRWESFGHQRVGDQVTLTFDRPVVVTSLEMDLGAFRNEYPRVLRVTARDGQTSVNVWEGRTRGAALLAALTDQARMPMVIHLDRQIPCRELALTVVGGDPDLPWSIAELKAFGR